MVGGGLSETLDGRDLLLLGLENVLHNVPKKWLNWTDRKTHAKPGAKTILRE